jgi:DNA-binding MarR family transcriptional regulator
MRGDGRPFGVLLVEVDVDGELAELTAHMSKDLQVGNQQSPSVPTASVATTEAITSGAAGGVVRRTGTPAPLPPIHPGLELDPLEHRGWRAFLHKHAVVARLLEADLMTRNGLPLAEFDVLFQLALSDGHRLRMNELADRVLLSRAGITRLVDRLVADGLVVRMKCASDARGAFASLTDRGLARLEEARPAHLAAVKRYFLGTFSRTELETLADLMERSIPLD